MPPAGLSVIDGAASTTTLEESLNRGRIVAIAMVASIMAYELPMHRRGPLLNGKKANFGSREARPSSHRSGWNFSGLSKNRLSLCIAHGLISTVVPAGTAWLPTVVVRRARRPKAYAGG